MYNFLCFGLIAAFIFTACKSTPTSNNPTENNKSSIETQTADSKADSNVVISFFSKGGGIDTEAREKTDELLTNFNLKNQTNLVAEQYRWGREGEVDYCINLSALKAANLTLFKQELNTLLANRERVRAEFNAVCSRRK
jgi:hypothetical protein